MTELASSAPRHPRLTQSCPRRVRPGAATRPNSAPLPRSRPHSGTKKSAATADWHLHRNCGLASCFLSHPWRIEAVIIVLQAVAIAAMVPGMSAVPQASMRPRPSEPTTLAPTPRRKSLRLLRQRDVHRNCGRNWSDYPSAAASASASRHGGY